jgi:hypothetical protein
MKRFLLSIFTVLICAAPAAAQIRHFRDYRGDLYIDGLPAGERLYVVRRATITRYAPRENCIHKLWHTSSKFWLSLPIILYATAQGDVQLYPPTLNLAASGSLPCNGASVNGALPWITIAPGIQAVRGFETRCVRRDYFGYCQYTKEISVVWVSGLGSALTQRVSDLHDRDRKRAKVNDCGFLKLLHDPVSFPIRASDRFSVLQSGSPYTLYGTFAVAGARGAKTLPDAQIPKCLDGVRYDPAP